MKRGPLSPGKIRALQTTSTQNGIFKILAVDHRDSLRVLIDPDNPGSVPVGYLTQLKLDIVKHITPAATAVMLDPVYSAGQGVVAGTLPGHVGFLCALEAQGYLGDPYARQTSLLDGWSVEKAKRLGASGIKLLVYYHPDAGQAAERQEEIIRAVIADCARYEIALFLEPLFYALDPHVPLTSSEFASQRSRIVIETVRRLGSLGPDVLKIPFPVDANYEPDQSAWKDACFELNKVSPVPWALLSAGDPFDIFQAQLQVACESGCSGYMAGRALWQEVVTAKPDDRPKILIDVVLPRFKVLSEIAESHGQSWQAKHNFPEIDDSWFRTY